MRARTRMPGFALGGISHTQSPARKTGRHRACTSGPWLRGKEGTMKCYEIMARDVITVRPEATVQRAAELMMTHGSRRRSRQRRRRGERGDPSRARAVVGGEAGGGAGGVGVAGGVERPERDRDRCVGGARGETP